MADDTKPARQPAGPESPAERPVVEREPLTVTVIEPAAAQETAVGAPPDLGVRVPQRVVRIPVPRWYWLLVGVAATLLVMDYKFVWAARMQKFMEHRILPPRVVQLEHSLWRHTFGDAKPGKEPHS